MLLRAAPVRLPVALGRAAADLDGSGAGLSAARVASLGRPADRRLEGVCFAASGARRPELARALPLEGGPGPEDSSADGLAFVSALAFDGGWAFDGGLVAEESPAERVASDDRLRGVPGRTISRSRSTVASAPALDADWRPPRGSGGVGRRSMLGRRESSSKARAGVVGALCATGAGTVLAFVDSASASRADEGVSELAAAGLTGPASAGTAASDSSSTTVSGDDMLACGSSVEVEAFALVFEPTRRRPRSRVTGSWA